MDALCSGQARAIVRRKSTAASTTESAAQGENCARDRARTKVGSPRLATGPRLTITLQAAPFADPMPFQMAFSPTRSRPAGSRATGGRAKPTPSHGATCRFPVVYRRPPPEKFIGGHAGHPHRSAFPAAPSGLPRQSARRCRPRLAAAQSALAHRRGDPDIVPREVGGGRVSRQPGQVRKEAAVTSSDPGRLSSLPPRRAPHLR
jgi:hypothetical protein